MCLLVCLFLQLRQLLEENSILYVKYDYSIICCVDHYFVNVKPHVNKLGRTHTFEARHLHVCTYDVYLILMLSDAALRLFSFAVKIFAKEFVLDTSSIPKVCVMLFRLTNKHLSFVMPYSQRVEFIKP